MTNWRLPSQDQQETFRRNLKTFNVTLTGQSHFMLIFLLRKVTLRGHINSVKWPPTCSLLQLRGGGSNLDDWKKSLALCLLCAMYKRNIKSAKWILLYSIQCAQKPLRVTLRNHTNRIPNRFNSTNVRGHIISIKSLYSVTPTPYYESSCKAELKWLDGVNKLRTFIVRSWCDRVHSWYGVDVTAFKVTLRSTKISIKWLWPVKVTLKVKRCLKVFCWSCEEGSLK